MGIETAWKQKLREDFPKAWNVENLLSCNVIIDEWELFLRQIVYEGRFWDTIESTLILHIRTNLLEAKVRDDENVIYIICIDDRTLRPPNKKALAPHILKRKRGNQRKEEKPAIMPYTEAEIKARNIRIGEDAIVGAARLLETKIIYPTIWSFVLEKLKYVVKHFRRNITFIVDGMLDEYNTYTQNFNLVKNERGKAYRFELTCLKDNGNKIDNTIVTLHEVEYSNLGEADLKLIHYTAKYIIENPKNRIFVKGCDTDFIPIFLGNMRNFIVPESKMIEAEIILDLTPIMHLKNKLSVNNNKQNDIGDKDLDTSDAKIAKQILDIKCLWRSILDHYDDDNLVGRKLITSDQTSYIIEFMCCLMILTGTDYKDRFEGIGLATVMKALNLWGGWSILFKEGPPIFMKWNSYFHDIKSKCEMPEQIVLREHIFFNFIMCIYDKIWNDKNTRPSPERIEVLIRHTSWHLDYILNSWKIHMFSNPTITDYKSGLPIYGWRGVMVPNPLDPTILKYEVYQSDKVHKYESNPLENEIFGK